MELHKENRRGKTEFQLVAAVNYRLSIR